MNRFYRTFAGIPQRFTSLLQPVVLCGVGLAALLMAGGAPAQDGDESRPLTAFLESLEVRIVNVEVFVTDRKGRPVLGLEREDFEVFEDGKKVELVNFLAPSANRATTTAEGPEAQNPDGTTVAPAFDQENTEEPSAVAGVDGSAEPRGQATHHVVLFIDNLNIAPHRRKRVVDRLREIVREQSHVGVHFLVATYDGRVEVRQGFTDDMQRVEAALDGLDRLAGPALARQNERLALLREGQQVFQTIAVANANSGAPETFNAMKELAESQITTLIHQVERYGQRMQAETERGVAALGNFVGALAARPGRKAVIYVSDGVEMRPGEELFYAMEEIFQGGRNLQVQSPGGDGGGGQGGGPGQGQGQAGGGGAGGGGGGNLNSEETINTLSFATRAERFSLSKVYRELTALANTHQVSFYTIDARAGLGGGGADASMSGTVGRLESGGMRAVRDANRWETLGVMAEDTGGLLMTGADVEGLFQRVATDFGGHYSLGYAPPDPGDGEPHKIRVKVKKRGTRLRYRQSYIDQNLEARLADRTTGTLLLKEDVNPHGLSLETLQPTEGENRGELLVPLLVKIPLRNLTLLPQGATHGCDVRLFITASSPDGFAGPVEEVAFQVEIPNEELGMAAGQEYSARVDLVVRPGRTWIAVGLMDETGGEGSFVRHEVIVEP